MKQQEKLSKKFVKVEIDLKNIDELKFDFLNLYIYELGLSSIEEQIINSKERFFIYLPIKSYKQILNKIKEFCENNLIEIEFINMEFIDESYLYKWQEYFRPILIEKFLIKPAWFDLKIIEIDPKNSFGTGVHPTTQICIEFIQKVSEITRENFIDCGCGSGILSIIAEKSGFRKVILFDKDYEAVSVSLENLKKNKCKNFIAFCGSFEALKKKKYKVVCANILSSILIEYQNVIKNLLDKNGFLILSGLEITEKEKFFEKFSFKNFKIMEVKEKNNWFGILAINNEI